MIHILVTITLRCTDHDPRFFLEPAEQFYAAHEDIRMLHMLMAHAAVATDMASLCVHAVTKELRVLALPCPFPWVPCRKDQAVEFIAAPLN